MILSVFGRGHSIAVMKSGLIGEYNISGRESDFMCV